MSVDSGAERPARGERPADPEQEREGFGEGQAQRGSEDDGHVGRFSEGQEELPVHPEDEIPGRFSEGQEELTPEEDPGKLAEGSFGTGQEQGAQ